MKPYYQDSHCTIWHGDWREVLPVLDAVNHIITDPPYTQRTSDNMRSRKDISDGGAYIGDNKRRRIDFDGIDGQELELSQAFLSKAERWILIFCALEQIGDYSRGAGNSYIRGTAWRRTNPAPQFTGDRPGQAHEGAVLLHKPGKKRWNRGGHTLAWSGPTANSCADPDRGIGHPTPKPLWLMLDCVDALTDQEETVLDPYCGSGTTLLAACELNRKSIGIEIEEKYCEIAANRLSNRQQPLFKPPIKEPEEMALFLPSEKL